MKKLSLKRTLSFVVIAAMMLAVLVVPVNAAPPAKSFNVTSTNYFDYGATDKTIIWTSANAEAVLGTILGVDPFFDYFNAVLLEYDEDARAFEVIEIEMANGGDSGKQNAGVYKTWTLGYGRILLVAQVDSADGATVGNLNTGDMLYYVGDYDSDLGRVSSTASVLLTSKETEGSWVKPPKPVLSVGFNIFPDVNSNLIGSNADVVAGLTDGEWVLDADSFSDAGVYLLHNNQSNDSSKHPSVSLIWIFEEETTIEAFKLGFYSEWNSMIGLPVDEIEISTADVPEEGADPFWWVQEDVSHGLTVTEREEPIGDTQVAELVLETPLTAQWFKIDLVFDDGPHGEAGKPVWEFMALTEVEVVLGEAGDDNTGDGNTGDDNTSDDNTSGEVEPPKAGDASNMAVFVVLALVAVLGSAVVVKTRK